MVIEDIAGIFMMIVLTTISVSKNVSGLATVREIGFLMICLVIWLLLGIYLIPTILNLVKGELNDELIMIISVGICLGMVVVANLLGFSSALGAFMAGSIPCRYCGISQDRAYRNSASKIFLALYSSFL